jgi:hypothetical protein
VPLEPKCDGGRIHRELTGSVRTFGSSPLIYTSSGDGEPVDMLPAMMPTSGAAEALFLRRPDTGNLYLNGEV